MNSNFTQKPIKCDYGLFTQRFLESIDGNEMYNHDLTPNFTDDVCFNNKSYRTLFGPHFYIPDLHLPGTGVAEHQTAIARMIEDRFPDDVGMAKMYRDKQLRVKRLHRGILHVFKRHIIVNLNVEHPQVAYCNWLDDKTNPKYKLRQNVNVEWNTSGCLKRRNYVEYKLKRGEALAPCKQRGIGDLTAEATQQTAFGVPALKAAWSNDFVADHYLFRFVGSAAFDDVQSAGVLLAEVPFGRVHFVYHSDDSCIAAYCCDGVVRMNMDISKCDNSHTTPIFEILEYLTCTGMDGVPHLHAASLRDAFSCLRLPLRMRNAAKYRESVKYVFNTMRLYSGSSLTTIVNNLANLLIGFSIRKLVPDPSKITKTAFLSAVIEGAAMVGYKVKHQVCNTTEEIQFLKHSFTYVDGYLVPWKNLGTWLRMFGTIRGDLPGSGDIEGRARAFASDVIVSRQNWGNHCLRDAFNTRVIKHNVRMKGYAYRESLNTHMRSGSELRISVDALMRRYKLDTAEFMELCDYVRGAQVGDIVFLPCVASIYMTDYG